MKTKICIVWAVCLLLLGFSLAGCLKYKELPDCDLQARFTVLDSTITCPDATCLIQFTDSSRGLTGLEYEWDFRDGTDKVSMRSPSHSFAPRAEPYRVLLTVRLGEGCVDTFSQNIRVLDGGPVAAFTTDQLMNMGVTNVAVTFSNQSVNYDILEWSFGDGETSNVNAGSVAHTYAVADDYPVRLIAIRGLRRDTFSLLLKIAARKFELPIAELGPARKIKQLPDRSYVLVGNTRVGTKSKPYLLFIDENGVKKPSIPITTVGDDAAVADFAVLPNGTYALVGTTNRTIGNKITQDIFYVWLTAAGTAISTLPLPAKMRTDALNESASAIITTADGGVLITGRVADPTTNSSDIYVFKSKTNLDNIDINQILLLPNFEEGIAAAEVPGGFVIAGQTRVNAFSNAPDILALKVNPLGVLSGSPMTFGTPLGEYAAALAKSADGASLMICGLTTGNGQEDFYLVKTDLNGNPIGTPKTVSDPLGLAQISKEINPLKNGGFVVTGIQSNNPCFFTTDADGNANPVKAFLKNGTEGFTTGVQTSDGGFIFAGYLENTKLYVVKTDKNGNF